jgi:hypothetical protein
LGPTHSPFGLARGLPPPPPTHTHTHADKTVAGLNSIALDISTIIAQANHPHPVGGL